MFSKFRCVIVAAVVAVVRVLANAWTVVAWLDALGAVGLAWWIHAEYVTGTAITLILVLLFLSLSTHCTRGARCRVCEEPIPQARYCPACVSPPWCQWDTVQGFGRRFVNRIRPTSRWPSYSLMSGGGQKTWSPPASPHLPSWLPPSSFSFMPKL